MTKCYLAVTVAEPDRQKPEEFTTDGWRMVSHNLCRIKDRTVVDGGGAMTQTARLRLKTLLENGTMGIHAVQLITGRKHQIRAQLSALAMPILGDRTYGSSIQPRSDCILLHSYLVQFLHPTRKTMVKVRCSPPEHFLSVFTDQERDKIDSALDRVSF